jgi:hypothetical protein
MMPYLSGQSHATIATGLALIVAMLTLAGCPGHPHVVCRESASFNATIWTGFEGRIGTDGSGIVTCTADATFTVDFTLIPGTEKG